MAAGHPRRRRNPPPPAPMSSGGGEKCKKNIYLAYYARTNVSTCSMVAGKKNTDLVCLVTLDQCCWSVGNYSLTSDGHLSRYTFKYPKWLHPLKDMCVQNYRNLSTFFQVLLRNRNADRRTVGRTAGHPR